jgi:hypothetical protein
MLCAPYRLGVVVGCVGTTRCKEFIFFYPFRQKTVGGYHGVPAARWGLVWGTGPALRGSMPPTCKQQARKAGTYRATDLKRLHLLKTSKTAGAPRLPGPGPVPPPPPRPRPSSRACTVCTRWQLQSASYELRATNYNYYATRNTRN